MHIETTGEGPDVVVLPGLPQQPEDVAPLVEALARHRRVHVVHFPGYGKAAAMAGAEAIDRVEAEIGTWLEDHAPGGYSIVGVSMGSYRAFRATAHGRLSPRGIVALGPLPYVPTELQSGWLGAIQALEAGEDLLPAIVRGMFSDQHVERDPACADVYLSQVQSVPLPTMLAELGAFAADEDLRPQLGQISVPVVLRVGALDCNTAPALSEAAVQQLPNASLVVVPEVAHLLHHEDLEATCAAVEDALSEFERAPGA